LDRENAAFSVSTIFRKLGVFLFIIFIFLFVLFGVFDVIKENISYKFYINLKKIKHLAKVLSL